MVSVLKYIVPPTTIGPVWNDVTSGREYEHCKCSRPTFVRSISASGEYLSPASVRPYAGQSAPSAAGAGLPTTLAREHDAPAIAAAMNGETTWRTYMAAPRC